MMIKDSPPKRTTGPCHNSWHSSHDEGPARRLVKPNPRAGDPPLTHNLSTRYI
jgi:hypothetical protein